MLSLPHREIHAVPVKPPRWPRGVGRIAHAWLVLFIGWVGVATAQHPWSELVVFGDSLSDVGNVRQRSSDLTFGLFPQPDDRYDRGRFSNGDVWIERVANALGLDASARSYRAPGTNYAYGGATTGGGSSNLTIVRNVGWQLDEYLLREARTPAADTLVVLWAGGNDFLNGGGDTTGPADNLFGYLERLYDAGARDFLVPNLPPLGQTPRFADRPAEQSDRDAVARQHNVNLAQRLAVFGDQRADADVFALDIETLFAGLLDDPAAAGIADTTGQAIDLPAGSDASGFLFWDDVHPTAAGHQLIADAALVLLAHHTDPGDYNASGLVEQGDLNQVLNNWGVASDAVSDGWISQRPTEGIVDQSELNVVLNHWGASTGPDFRGSALPEPTVMGPLVLVLARRRRRVRRRPPCTE